MPFTVITTALGEPLSIIHTIYNEPSTPQHQGYRNCLIFGTLVRQHLVDFIKSHDWAYIATYAKLFCQNKTLRLQFYNWAIVKKGRFLVIYHSSKAMGHSKATPIMIYICSANELLDI